MAWLLAEGEGFKLSGVTPDDARDPLGRPLERAAAEQATQDNLKALQELQTRLYAEHQRSVLVVLQAMDAGGKDGLIRNVFGALNNQGVLVTPFKAPTATELAHDFLWRIHQHSPKHGHIAVFNRSHYEDVLVARVRSLVPEDTWRRRYAHIRAFEELLADSGTTILKFMLHISRDEQKKRLQARLDDPSKHWKFDVGDLQERTRWDAYQQAYEDAIRATSTVRAPWFVIPSDRKWFRNYAVSTVLRETLASLDPRYPAAAPGLDKIVIE